MTRTDFILALLTSLAIAAAIYTLLYAPQTSNKPWDKERDSQVRNVQPRGPQ